MYTSWHSHLVANQLDIKKPDIPESIAGLIYDSGADVFRTWTDEFGMPSIEIRILPSVTHR